MLTICFKFESDIYKNILNERWKCSIFHFVLTIEQGYFRKLQVLFKVYFKLNPVWKCFTYKEYVLFGISAGMNPNPRLLQSTLYPENDKLQEHFSGQVITLIHLVANSNIRTKKFFILYSFRHFCKIIGCHKGILLDKRWQITKLPSNTYLENRQTIKYTGDS